VRRALLLLALLWTPARADEPARPPPPREQRIAYITAVLEAIRASDPTALADATKYITAVERNKCRAPEQSLRVGCLLEAVAQRCRQSDATARERCQRVSDVIVTNRLSEPVFVPKDVRYKLLNENRDYKVALARELHTQYASRVAEWAMSRHFPGTGASSAALAAGIDGYCGEIAGTRELSWQYCVAAIVWSIGTDGGHR
jgi:hypothetical protein